VRCRSGLIFITYKLLAIESGRNRFISLSPSSVNHALLIISIPQSQSFVISSIFTCSILCKLRPRLSAENSSNLFLLYLLLHLLLTHTKVLGVGFDLLALRKSIMPRGSPREAQSCCYSASTFPPLGHTGFCLFSRSLTPSAP
jgi:hypothetical protein